MAKVGVDASTVRIVVNNQRELNRLVEAYGDYIAVIHQGDDRHLLVYDAKTMVETVVAGCLCDTPRWWPRLSPSAQ